MTQDSSLFVVTIDGPSGAGKGTVAQRLASKLGFHLLDSGAVYRAAALHALENSADLSNEGAVLASVRAVQPRFLQDDGQIQVFIGDKDVTVEFRSERTADAASRIAAMPSVREALLQLQREFAQPPGLVADGRDMGTVVFPQAQLKVFLTASASERARRRHKQLKEKGTDAKLEGLMREIEARDLRDSTRKSAPLAAAEDALVIDSTSVSIDLVTEKLLQEIADRRNIAVP